jgi:pimeloyl-ACP methyl ester carboxylesterase
MNRATYRSAFARGASVGIRRRQGLCLNGSAALVAIALCMTVMSIRQVWADGADLFAPSWNQGKLADAERALPLTAFYGGSFADIPAKPGALVRAETAIDFNLPPGVTATRILYHTRTANNHDALASGVVLVPYGTPPAGGWPLLAWSHGTSGVARVCAPSLMNSLFYNWEGLYEYVMLGFAVVATDYAGLGTEGRHAYLDMLSNGADVIYSVPAARAAVANLSSRWVIVGHSQGGLSSLGAAQLEAERQDAGYLGTVVLAGASDLEDLIDAGLAAKAPVLNGLLAFVVYGFQTLYPQLAAENVLTDSAAKQYRSVTDGCSAASGAFTPLPADGMYRSNWKQDPSVQKMLERVRPGVKPARGPLLLVTGGADPMFTPEASEIVFRRLCRSGQRVQRSVYPGLGHDPLVYGSLTEQIEWMKGRFSGATAPSNCTSAKDPSDIGFSQW